jgi:D-alanyl-D-alanine dipeptidase
MGRRVAATLAVCAVLTAGTGAPPVSAQPDPVARPDLVSLSDVDPSIPLDIRYATEHNFTGRRVDGYEAPLCLLARPAAEALRDAQRDFLSRGYSLKVYDCYRPQRAVDDFVSWARDLADQQMKAEFYPRVDKSRLFADGYIAEKSGHSRASTVDLTLVALPARPEPVYVAGQPLVDCTAPAGQRFADAGIDMGTGYDCFDTLAHTLDPRVQGSELDNRLLLMGGLKQHGFENYDKEWWHFTLTPEVYPDTLFDVAVAPSSAKR